MRNIFIALISLALSYSLQSQCIGIHVMNEGVESGRIDSILEKVQEAYRLIGITTYIDDVVDAKVEYRDFTSADLLLFKYAYGPSYSDINLYLTDRDMGGGASYKDVLCTHIRYVSGMGRDIGIGPFAVISGVRDVEKAAVLVSRKIAHIIGVGELSGPCDGTIMGSAICASMEGGFGDYSETLRELVYSAECLQSTDDVFLEDQNIGPGYISARSITLNSVAVQDMTLATYEFEMISGTLDNVEIVQTTCKYLQK